MPAAPDASSKTAPVSGSKPPKVVPYRFPASSRINPARGLLVPVPLKVASVVMLLLPAASSKTVPPFSFPALSVPELVVPYKLPVESRTRVHWGLRPFVPLNAARVVMLLAPDGNSKTVP